MPCDGVSRREDFEGAEGAVVAEEGARPVAIAMALVRTPLRLMPPASRRRYASLCGSRRSAASRCMLETERDPHERARRSARATMEVSARAGSPRDGASIESTLCRRTSLDSRNEEASFGS